MVMNTIHATYTETYDLNTAINEVSLLGIHTPQATALKSMFKGFFENYKKYKIVGCNLGMVCASTQSISPDQLGLPGGSASIDPRDVLNPILFKACTGENLNSILNQIYTPAASGTTNTSSVEQKIDSSTSAINMYYQMLSDDSWRKEHPQRGLFIKGLKPYVHKIVTTQPFKWTGASTVKYEDYPRMSPPSASTDPSDFSSPDHAIGFGSVGGQSPSTNGYPNMQRPTTFISDGITDMPWLDTTFDGAVNNSADTGQVRSNNVIVSVPRVFCGCIILPPAILQKLYFRCQIQWHVMFKDFRPAYEVGPLYGTTDLEHIGGLNYFDGSTLADPNCPTYWNIYHDASTKLDKEFSSFDVNGSAEVSQIMESAN